MTQLAKVFEVPLTMSSVEIAELTGKRHDNVMRKAKELAEKGIITSPQIEELFTVGNGAKNSRTIYRLNKTESLNLVANLSPEFTARIIDRWQALEAQQPAFEIPQTLPDALMLAAQLAQEAARLEAELKAAEPKLLALDKIAVAKDSLCLQEAAKALQMRPTELIAWLQAHEWIYKRAGASQWLGYQAKVQTGLLEHKVTTVSRSDGSEKVVTQVRVTTKGLTRLGSVCVA